MSKIVQFLKEKDHALTIVSKLVNFLTVAIFAVVAWIMYSHLSGVRDGDTRLINGVLSNITTLNDSSITNRVNISEINKNMVENYKTFYTEIEKKDAEILELHKTLSKHIADEANSRTNK